MYDWLILPIELPPSMSGGTQISPPVFRSSVDCPASLGSALSSCPELRTWFVVVALGGLLVGYLVARK